MSFVRALSLIILGCVLCVSILAGRDARGRSQLALPTAQSSNTSPSPTPQPSSETKRPNPIRRIFSWTSDQLTRPFRREPRLGCGLGAVVDSITTSKSLITICPTTTTGSSNLSCSPEREVKLVAYASGPDDTQFLYTWTVTVGTLRGEGRAEER